MSTEGMDVGEQIVAEVDGDAAGAAAPGEASGPTGGAPASAALEGETSTDAQTDLASVIAKMIDEESGQGPAQKKPEPLDPKLLEGLPPGASERVQQAVNAKREAEERAAQYEQTVGSMQQYIGQLQQAVQQVQAAAQQQVHSLQTQLAELKGQMTVMGRMPQQPQDPAEQLQENWLGKAKEVFEGLLQERDQRYEKLNQEFTSYKENQEVGRLSQEATNTALRAVREVALKGLPEDLTQDLVKPLMAQVLATQLHLNVPPEQAAKVVRATLLKFAHGLTRAQGKALSEAAKKAAGVPTAPSGKRVGGGGAGQQSIADIRKMGYTDELDPEYMARQ